MNWNPGLDGEPVYRYDPDTCSIEPEHYAPAGVHALSGAFSYEMPNDRNWPGRLAVIWGVVGSLLALVPILYPFVFASAVGSLLCGYRGRALFSRGVAGNPRIIQLGISAGIIAACLGAVDLYLCWEVAQLLGKSQELHIDPV